MAKKSFQKKGSGSFHSLNCKYCGTQINRCDINSVKVTCSKCVHQLVEGNRLEERK